MHVPRSGFEGRSEGPGMATPILISLDYLENYYKKMVEIFCLIPFTLNSPMSKLILEIFHACRTTQQDKTQNTKHLIE